MLKNEKSLPSNNPNSCAVNVRYLKTNKRPTLKTTPVTNHFRRTALLWPDISPTWSPINQPTIIEKTIKNTNIGSPHA